MLGEKYLKNYIVYNGESESCLNNSLFLQMLMFNSILNY